ncbi:MAG: xanthine permease [Actinomycetes bacterium]|jgi:uracil permease|nr:xanthine permease [Actinomycetes bacterium]
MATIKSELGYLPDETPSLGKLLLFALQQVLVMFPATVTVALLTGFHVSTTIFASGLATLGFLLVTRGKIPLYYGSSFSYLAPIMAMTSGQLMANGLAPDAIISQAQFGIIMSGLVSIVAGLIVSRFGMEKIEKVLPPTITGSIALIIGITLAGTALTSAIGYDATADTAVNASWVIALITLLATVGFSVYLKGVLGQLPILFGIIVGYVAALLSPFVGGPTIVDFSAVFSQGFVSLPHFTLPDVTAWPAVLAIMPIAIATIPESTAHLFQLDIYVNDLARKKGKKPYHIADKLGINLVGDGLGDIIASLFGGPAGTNYGENISTMAITKNFSVVMLGVAAVLAILLSFVTPLSNFINTVPGAVINGACIFLFGVIAAQGVAIMIEKKVDMFSARNLSVIAVTMIIGVGGYYACPNGIPFFGIKLPAIATAAIFGIVLNLILSIGGTKAEAEQNEELSSIVD